MAVLRCDSCGGDTFEALAEPGYFRCHSCGAAGSVKLVASVTGPSGVRLVSSGNNKIAVIKAVRQATGFDLKRAKDLVDAADRAPQTIPLAPGSGASIERLISELTAAGARVEHH